MEAKIDFKIDYKFFCDSLNYLHSLNEQRELLEKVLDCDIYGGPMKAWGREFDFWSKVIANDEKLDIFIAFINAQNLDQLAPLVYSTKQKPIYGRVVAETHDTIPKYYTCHLYKPLNTSWTQCIWQILAS